MRGYLLDVNHIRAHYENRPEFMVKLAPAAMGVPEPLDTVFQPVKTYPERVGAAAAIATSPYVYVAVAGAVPAAPFKLYARV